MEKKNNYNAESITVLEGLEAVRKRPGMYIGSTSEKGLHHLVWEIVDNSVDESLAGYCDKIEVKILPNNVIQVIDNGRGIPTEMHSSGKSTLEVVLTVLHAGGKFNNNNYKISGGLHGVGVSVVNALSKSLTATIKREGKIWQQSYIKGEATGPVKIIGEANPEEHGTTITFKADDEIFDTTVYDYNILSERFKELSYLNQGLTIILTDERTEKKTETFHSEGGLKDFLKDISSGELLSEEIIYLNGTAVNNDKRITEIEIAMNWTTSQKENVYSFVNNINTIEGGTHVSGFRTALTRVVNDVAKKMELIKKEENFQGNDIREGLNCVISIKVPEPEFEGQTKTKLGNSETSAQVSQVVTEGLKTFLEDHPKETSKIIEKMLIAKKARLAAKKARELVMRKNTLEVGSLPGKLADCSSKDPNESEIFIVEGNSAGGSAKQGRNRNFQAILPLRGKILNVEKVGMHKILENEEIRSMITAFGTGIDNNFNIDKLRYNKIVIMTDADVDGAHITTLMLTFFFRHLKPLIENGNIYIACPPLYKISYGKSIQYAYNDIEMKEKVRNLENKGIKYGVQRYKGLGEMNPEQLWETTLDPDTRLMLQVTIEDAEYANKMFNILMGDKVEPRRKFIEENAQYVKNLDI
jgi:DNA gyrase, B subunit